MYGSEAPCGDASMELIMAALEDATPWELSAASNRETTLKGRGSFAELGIVRRKPSRPDAPPTLSKSCSDKLTMYQFTSVLNSVTSLLVSPEYAYISTLTLPASQCVEAAIKRAFTTSGRLPDLKPQWYGGYSFRPFIVQTTSLEFAWSRRALTQHDKSIPSNISAVYTPDVMETLINGILQGRRVDDPKGASKICRKSLWKAAVEVAKLLDNDRIKGVLYAESYGNLKKSELLEPRRRVKDDVRAHALEGWIRNARDEQFSIE
jgi:tRNA-specific adenosine deaminase 1